MRRGCEAPGVGNRYEGLEQSWVEHGFIIIVNEKHSIISFGNGMAMRYEKNIPISRLQRISGSDR